MDRFSSISLFDFFSFIIPGFLMEAGVYVCYSLSGISFSFDFPLLIEKDAVVLIYLSIGAYLAGHIVHYVSHQKEWFGANSVKLSFDSNAFLNTETYLAANLDNKCRQQYNYPLLDENGKPLSIEIDRFFETSFRLLEHNGLLNTSRTLQVQFLLFLNVYTALMLTCILGLGTMLYSIVTSGHKPTIIILFVFVTISAILTYCCYKIAVSRRKQFIQTIWWQFYTYYNAPIIKPQ